MSDSSTSGDTPSSRLLSGCPRRLLEDGGTPLEMALLRSAKDDGPPPGAMDRAMVAVGLTGVIGAGAGASAPASGVYAKPAGSVMKSLFELLTWAFLGAAAGALFMGDPGANSSSSAISTEMRPSTVVEQGSAPAPAGDPRGEPEQGAAEDVSPAPLPGDEGGSAKALRGTQQGAPSAPRSRKVEAPRPTLAEEVALLDAARKALSAGNASGALDALQGHEQRFSSGALTAEAAVLKIEALAARGDHAGAAAQARAFLSAHPNTPHAAHVRDILHEQEPRALADPRETPKR